MTRNELNRDWMLRQPPEYKIWRGMKSRCHCKGDQRFPRYGGRGIIVCERWRNSFATFIADMGIRPSSAHQIDRIDNNGNYEPKNCRWCDRTTNMRNNSWTRLSAGVVAIVKRQISEGISPRQIALVNSIPIGNVYNIKQGKSWKETNA